MRRSKKLPPDYLTKRQRLLAPLRNAAAMDPAAREVITKQGFIRYFLALQPYYLTNEQAYEAVESEHLRITGQRKYAEYISFKNVLSKHFPK